MKREIIAFLSGPANAKVRDEKKFDIYTSKDDRTYAVVIVAGGYDKKEDCILQDKAVAIWGDEKFLKEVLAIGRKVLIED